MGEHTRSRRIRANELAVTQFVVANKLVLVVRRFTRQVTPKDLPANRQRPPTPIHAGDQKGVGMQFLQLVPQPMFHPAHLGLCRCRKMLGEMTQYQTAA